MPQPKILVVDDTPEVLHTVQYVLEHLGGWQVETAEDGDMCVEAARAYQPDLIILDVQMPRMEGPDAFRALQRNKDLKDIPVLFLTAVVRMDVVMGLIDLGARGVLHKPFDPMYLVTEVAHALRVPVPEQART